MIIWLKAVNPTNAFASGRAEKFQQNQSYFFFFFDEKNSEFEFLKTEINFECACSTETAKCDMLYLNRQNLAK
jgi:hypothetical protein